LNLKTNFIRRKGEGFLKTHRIIDRI